jgi:hypothetical protein
MGVMPVKIFYGPFSFIGVIAAKNISPAALFKKLHL